MMFLFLMGIFWVICHHFISGPHSKSGQTFFFVPSNTQCSEMHKKNWFTFFSLNKILISSRLQRRICDIILPPQKWPYLDKRWGMCWIEFKIILAKHPPSVGFPSPSGGVAPSSAVKGRQKKIGAKKKNFGASWAPLLGGACGTS